MKTNTVLKNDMVASLRSRKGYALGRAWHGKESLVLVVPVLLAKDPRERGYVLIEEVKDKTDVTDTGSINRLKVQNRSGKLVFIRSGAIFSGIGTQSRAVEKSAFVAPGREVEVSVRCVHMSHGISMGAKFEVLGTVPVSVHTALYSGNQRTVWNNVYSLSSMSAQRRGPRASWRIPTDSLVEVQRDLSKEMDRYIKEMPSLENQVGIVVMDVGGVLGIEVFDHPDSWKAVSETVLQKYGEAFLKKPKTAFDITANGARIGEAVNAFLDSLGQMNAEQVDDRTSVFSGEVEGEFTVLDRATIHLLALRKDTVSDEDAERDRHTVETFMSQEYAPQWPRAVGRAQRGGSEPMMLYMSSANVAPSVLPSPVRQTVPKWTKRAERKKSLLIKGWKADTLSSVDIYAKKEGHTKSRSGAIRKLVEAKLQDEGYLEEEGQ